MVPVESVLKKVPKDAELNKAAGAGADAFDVAAVEAGAGEVLPDDGLGPGGGVDDVAGHLGQRDALAEEAEGPGRVIPRLRLQPVEGDGALRQARTGAALGVLAVFVLNGGGATGFLLLL